MLSNVILAVLIVLGALVAFGLIMFIGVLIMIRSIAKEVRRRS